MFLNFQDDAVGSARWRMAWPQANAQLAALVSAKATAVDDPPNAADVRYPLPQDETRKSTVGKGKAFLQVLCIVPVSMPQNMQVY